MAYAPVNGLDGVVQAPGGRDENTSGGFRHGGWSIRTSTLGCQPRPEMQARRFELTSAATSATGVQVCRYRPVD